MTTFAYTAREANGASVTGTIAADDAAHASQLIRAEGRYPIAIHTADSATARAANGPRGIRIPRSQVIEITSQLSVMIETGVTLSEGLDCIAQQTIDPKAKALLEDIGAQVQQGSDLSSSLQRHPRSFPRMFIALIKASEKSGMLARMLLRANAYMRDEQDTIRRVRGALTYPAMMLTFAVSTTIFLLAFVLPRFTAIYASKGASLPAPTRILMALSGFIVNHWPVLLIGTLAAAVGLIFYRKTPGGQKVFHFIALHIPLIGPVMRKVQLSRALRMLGTLGSAGVNLVDGVTMTRDLCSNVYYQQLWSEVLEKIQTGRQLSEPMFGTTLVPRPVAQMLHSGEKSGKLSQVMEQVAGFAEEELKAKIAELTRYIEPIMIVVMGCIIGGVSLALMLPIFTISRVVAH